MTGEASPLSDHGAHAAGAAERLRTLTLEAVAGLHGIFEASGNASRPARRAVAHAGRSMASHPTSDPNDTPVTTPASGASPNAPPASPPAALSAAPEVERIDERLLVASRGGDRDAFRSLMERHREDLLRFLYRFLGSRSAADDVFQDTFLQVHLAADTFDAERRFRPWLYAIAANKARDFHRRQRRRSAASLSAPIGDSDASLVDLLAADAPSPEAPTASAEMQRAVKQVVDEMPTHYREILLLAYFQKMSYHQIAECLTIPLGTVKSRLHAAVAHFATSWKASRAGRPDDEE